MLVPMVQMGILLSVLLLLVMLRVADIKTDYQVQRLARERLVF